MESTFISPEKDEIAHRLQETKYLEESLNKE